MRYISLIALLFLPVTASVAQDETTALQWVETAIDRAKAQGALDNIAFRAHERMTQKGEDPKDRVFTYDPSQIGPERYALIQLNGAEPSEEEAQKFAADRFSSNSAGILRPLNFEEEWGAIDQAVLRSKLRLEGWEDGIARLRFIDGVPVTGNTGSDAFSKHVEGRVKVQLDQTGQPFISALEIFIEKPFKPNLAAKIKEFSTVLSYNHDNTTGLIILTSIDVRTAVKAFFKRFELSQMTTYSDFRAVEPAEAEETDAESS